MEGARVIREGEVTQRGKAPKGAIPLGRPGEITTEILISRSYFGSSHRSITMSAPPCVTLYTFDREIIRKKLSFLDDQ